MKGFLVVLMAVVFNNIPAAGQKIPDTVTSLVNPQKEISKEVIKATREFRERLLDDPYRPAYHFSFPEDNGLPGDPNGAFYHDGLYHLMYLYNKTGTGFAWGHVSSPDMLHWRYHPDAIVPGNGDEGCFSGGAFVEDDGTAVLSYWMLWGAKGIGIAKSTGPDFNNWEKSKDNPVIKSTEWGITELKDSAGKDIHVGSADPSNIWKKNGKYYMLTGNLLVLNKYGRKPENPADEKGDRLYLFESENLKDWSYLHRFYESRREWTDTSEDNMCPSFLPLPSSPEGGTPSNKYFLLSISHNKGCQYYIGDYKNDRFLPERHGRMTWKDNAYFAPEALIDNQGRQIMWAWIFDDRPDSIKKFYGWTGIYGLPRSLWLAKDGTLGIQPVKELQRLRGELHEQKNILVKSGTAFTLPEPGDELMELEITLLPGKASQAGVLVNCSSDNKEQTSIYYDGAAKKLIFDATRSSIDWGRRNIEAAPFELKKSEPLVLHVFVDKGIVEVFANDRQAIARTVYPKLKGRIVKLFSNGADIHVSSVKAWKLAPSNPF
jgi:beta-fructofuranosidase